MWSSSIRVRERSGRHRLALAAGVLALLVAAGPIETGAADSLTTHMAQHLLLLAVAPPLLVVGIGVPVLDRSWSLWAAAAVTVHSAVMTSWHLPGPFEFALDHSIVHLVEHASLLAAGLVFWWVIIGGGRRARYGA